MSATKRVTSSNQLIAALPAPVRRRFLIDCSFVDLALGSVLFDVGERIGYVYFPSGSFISMLKTVDAHSTLEVGMIGSEGMCGHSLILGDAFAPLRAITQGAGKALRMQAGVFARHLESLPALRQLMHRYLDVLARQLAQTAACTRFHVVEKRLARWLLMTQDRAHADSFDVTQEFLAFMLGVRRVGITTAASMLKSRQLIRYARGKITIVHRARLEAAACECYRSDLETYRRGFAAVRNKRDAAPRLSRRA
jgi:CRP-like cAMP-binding protein